MTTMIGPNKDTWQPYTGIADTHDSGIEVYINGGEQWIGGEVYIVNPKI